MDNQIKTRSQAVSPGDEFNAPSAPAETRTCHNFWCNYTTDRALSRCPKCGRPLLTVQTYRLLGLALVLLGGVLALAGALLLILAAPKLVGGTGVKLFVWGIFGTLLAVGLTTMTAGFWQALFGRRSQSLMTLVIALLIALALIVMIGRSFL